MNQLIELHDSEVAAVTVENGSVRVLFSHAYIHRSEGEPGKDPGTGWSQKAELLIHNPADNVLSAAFPWMIIDGEIEIDGTVLDNTIPIPFVVEGIFKMKLDVLDGEENFLNIEISGIGARLELMGEASFVEDFTGVFGNP